MCGFAGYAGEREYDTSVIRKMTDKIRHRGPDSQDAFIEGKVGLGFLQFSGHSERAGRGRTCIYNAY